MNNINSAKPSPFHPGEQKIQERLGVRAKMERFGRQVIHDTLPEQHRDFYRQLPFVFVGHADQQEWPWASILFDPPGFMHAENNTQLQINTQPVVGDPLTQALKLGTRLGLLGIMLDSRRRNRVSGYISQVHQHGIELSINQAFGNCPQYIQTRTLHTVEPLSMPPATVELLTAFDQQAIELISQSDTFFVASHVTNNSNSASEGTDVSHRGGKPGFIRVDDAYTLTIPDYLGNFHFNTLGNFLENPKAGLLFLDFKNGHLLTLTGSVEILWDSAGTEFFVGAERLWKFHIDHGYWLKNAHPLRWQLQEYSANTNLTGSWPEADAAKKAQTLRNTWQPYQVTKIVQESKAIKSFYLQPSTDQKPSFQAGQFLILKADIDATEYIRTYTISSAPGDPEFRISVKHEQGNNETPQGLFSSYLHQQIRVGDTIEAKAPAGAFTLATIGTRPAVLISAGIGITPMLAMAHHSLQEGIRTRSMRPIIMICCARNKQQRAFFSELNELATNSAGHIQVFWILSQPEPDLLLGVDYHHNGRINKPLLETLLPSVKCDIYLCGPNSFMQSQYAALRQLGISNAHIFTEAFGPAALIRDKQTNTQTPKQAPVAEAAIISFTDSQVVQAWAQDDGNLLAFAQAHGLNPNYGCRNGQCGTCKVKLLKGKISYQQQPSFAIKEDEVLLCCAVPAVDSKTRVTQLEIGL